MNQDIDKLYEEIQAEKEEAEKEEAMQFDSLNTSFHVKDLKRSFNMKHNVREDYDLESLIQDIVKVRRVINPVHIFAKQGVSKEDFESSDNPAKLLGDGAQGFRRVNSMVELTKNSQKYLHGNEVDPNIPTIVIFGLEPHEQVQYRLDHGSQKGLNAYELALCIKQMLESGRGHTEQEIIWHLRNLFYQSASLGERNKLDQKLKDRKKIKDPIKNQLAEKKILLTHWRGTFQYYKRILLDPTGLLMNNLYKQVYGYDDEDPPIQISRAEVAEISKLYNNGSSNKEIEEKFNEIKERKETPKDEQPKPWSIKVLKDKREFYKGSRTFDTIFRAILGDEDAQDQLPELRDWLIEVEKEHDPQEET